MADQWPDINNENLSSATKKLWIPNVVSQVVFKMPMLAKMYLSGQVKKAWDGGTVITRPVKVARMENLAQSFDENDQLTGGRVSMLKTPSFQWKDNQVPLVYTRREATELRVEPCARFCGFPCGSRFRGVTDQPVQRPLQQRRFGWRCGRFVGREHG